MKLPKSQKGFTPIILIVLVPIAIVFAYFFYKNFSHGTPPQIPTTPQIQTNNPIDTLKKAYDKVEADSYVFYYPKGYVISDPKKDEFVSKNDTLHYQNPNSKAIVPEFIFLQTLKGTKKVPTASFDFCSKFAESIRKSSKEKIDVEIVSDTKIQGCKIRSTTPVDGVNDAVVSLSKFIYSRDDTDYTTYLVKTLYYSNASKDEAQKLDGAIELFTLK